MILYGKPVAEKVRAAVGQKAESFHQQHGRPPGLSVVLVGDDPASQVYVGTKEKVAKKLGFSSQVIRLPAESSMEDIQKTLAELNHDPHVDGILVQLPLPKHLDPDAVIASIDPKKDVDALHPETLGWLVRGRPIVSSCTPAGIIELLKHYEVPIEGKKACVVGRSLIVGKPIAMLLLEHNATVTLCHSRTKDLLAETRAADIVVVAAGKPQFLSADAFQSNAVVIDVGIHKVDGKLVGDVDFENVSEKVSALTPVPGGVGPMTIAMLMKNTLSLAELHLGQGSR